MRAPIAALALLLALPGPALAQDWPTRGPGRVTDRADLLPPAAEARLEERLRAAEAETGVETLVLTIDSREAFAPGVPIDSFATEVFNRWGIGDAARNDGILILVVHADQEMRIALGAGFDRAWDDVAEAVIEEHFLPAFRQERYADGIEAGTEATLARIAGPASRGTTPDAPGGRARRDALILLGFFAATTGLLFRRRLGDLVQRVRRCPACGHRGLIRAREAVPAEKGGRGAVRVKTYCPACGYSNGTSLHVFGGQKTDEGPDSRGGGGRSSGGGASGRW